MSPSRRSSRRRFTLVLLVLTAVTFLTLDFRHSGPVESLRGGVASVFDPVGRVVASAVRPVGNAWNSAFHYDELKKRNERLQKRIDALEGERFEASFDEHQYKQLLAQANIEYLGDLPTATAQVTSGPFTNFADTIQIDKGAGDGVKVGMAVVTDLGLVGRVSAVHGGQSTVQLITDPNLGLGIRLSPGPDRPPEELGAVGAAHGTGSGRALRVDGGVPNDAPVVEGELVVTSGSYASPYPKGIPIGKVVNVRSSTDRTQQVFDIEPLVHLDRLSYVKVVLWQPAP